MADHLTDIKRLLKGDKLIMGKDETIKGLKRSEVERVYVTANCDATLKGDVEYYSKLAGVEVIHLDTPNDELGTLCKKPFAISVLAVRK
jgi:large subunit ribosomal protein L30e